MGKLIVCRSQKLRVYAPPIWYMRFTGWRSYLIQKKIFAGSGQLGYWLIRRKKGDGLVEGICEDFRVGKEISVSNSFFYGFGNKSRLCNITNHE